ncbi:hypothetical protein CL619_01950 [archaeon]|nr:hypothetical protein [archaeon]|tara:strand:- start:1013 stop:2287 length:1275 start_codon:yes stop_codon:yes gene_type:complete
MKNQLVVILFLGILLLLVSCTSVDTQYQESHEQEEGTKTDSNLEVEEEIIVEEKEGVEEIDEMEQIEEEHESLSFERNRDPSLPSEAEQAELLECEGLEFNNYPVDMSEVYEISPIGNLGPPGHTFPTEHSFIHIGSYETNYNYDLFAPADVVITHVSKYPGSIDPWEHTIYFALCKDVIGYYNHVKELSSEFEAILDEYECEDWTEQTEGSCSKNVFFEVEAGMLLGQVGANQGNFDFGLMDLRSEHEYANPDRNGGRTPHITCAYKYYPNEMRDVFFDLIERDDEEQCGNSAQDILGTLQGNWYYGDSLASEGIGWDHYLAFVHDNEYPELQAVSVGGVFTDSGVWYFEPQNSGTVNRNFAEILPGDEIYCYEAQDTDRWQETIPEGKVLVQLASETELLIEKQSGSCESSLSFNDAFAYSR